LYLGDTHFIPVVDGVMGIDYVVGYTFSILRLGVGCTGVACDSWGCLVLRHESGNTRSTLFLIPSILLRPGSRDQNELIRKSAKPEEEKASPGPGITRQVIAFGPSEEAL